MSVSKKDYAAAKARHESWTDAEHADPSPEMLADVKTIRRYEHDEDRAAQKKADAEHAARMAAEDEEF